MVISTENPNFGRDIYLEPILCQCCLVSNENRTYLAMLTILPTQPTELAYGLDLALQVSGRRERYSVPQEAHEAHEAALC